MDKFRIFVSADERQDSFNTLEELKKEIENLKNIMTQEDMFVVLKNNKLLYSGKFLEK